MEILLGFSLIANVAFGWMLWQSQKDSAKERTAILAEAQKEREQLANRIQAPEATVALSMSDDEGLDNVKFDDDEDFHKSMQAVENLEREFGVVGGS